ncbi:MAG: hypothetical protein JO227_04805 [Acetobacteraceae bacterium]|nr:hypothetical protein [Acetobacteraceae bacterium]
MNPRGWPIPLVSLSKFVGAVLVSVTAAAWGQPVSAQVTLPPDLISPKVPHDVPSGSVASVQDLAIFAWREFIALNWPARDPATTNVRGRANPNSDFLTITANRTGTYPLLVWQTYRHKNELFPAGGPTQSSFDSTAPAYKYVTQPTAAGDVSYDLFNNLDESSEIGLCTMFAHKDVRIVYEAKVNRAEFDYANKNGLTNCSGPNCPTLADASLKTSNDLVQYGGICSTDRSIVSLPCGDAAVDRDAGEGAIEIKAAWRMLTDAEMASGRFYTHKVIYYKGGPDTQSGGSQQYYNAVFGLVALHIIHKTKSFPTFVFATWEQVDDFDDASNSNPEDLAFLDLQPPAPNNMLVFATRAHPVHSQIPPVNDAVHAAFKAKAPTTVWQYYKLVGVQAMPMNGPPPAGAPSDMKSYYYLANIVVETNNTLQNFFGAAFGGGVPTQFQNVYLHGAAGSPFQMGGCQGCHGAAGQALGGEMSVLLSSAPLNSNSRPESIDAGPDAALRSYLARSAAILARSAAITRR